jgi:dTDP-4-amino-4,6-dideoxygalactose transaminase
MWISICVARKITQRTRAVMFVGLGGNTGQYETIVELCREKNLILILDAAHMSGTRLHGTHIGADADCSVFSFHAVKNLATADSGMICFKDQMDDERARKLSWLGINKDTYKRTVAQQAYQWMYDVEEVGYKYHGNSIMAAIALVSLKYLDRDNAYRRQLAIWYTEQLAQVSGIECVPTAPGCESSRHLYQIRIKKREEVLLALNAHEIYPGVHYRDNTEYRMYRYAKDTCPHAHAASLEVLSLPMHMAISQVDIMKITETLTHILHINNIRSRAKISCTISV